jgi:Ala-tRNA(Pro) deacylase
MADAYERLVALLDTKNATYRLIDHAPEGRTEEVSAMRGHPAAQAAKCVIITVKLGKKVTRHVLAVVPGDRRVDLARLKALLGGTYAGFASREVAERLAGSVSGTILPFAWHPDLELIVDPELTAHPRLYFNAARLDRSVALATSDYLALAEPRIERIAE